MVYAYKLDDRVHFNGEWHVVVETRRSTAHSGVVLKLVREVAMARPLRTGARYMDARIVDADKVQPSEAVKKRAALARSMTTHEPLWTVRR